LFHDQVSSCKGDRFYVKAIVFLVDHEQQLIRFLLLLADSSLVAKNDDLANLSCAIIVLHRLIRSLGLAWCSYPSPLKSTSDDALGTPTFEPNVCHNYGHHQQKRRAASQQPQPPLTPCQEPRGRFGNLIQLGDSFHLLREQVPAIARPVGAGQLQFACFRLDDRPACVQDANDHFTLQIGL
jgi:hypothetical protein